MAEHFTRFLAANCPGFEDHDKTQAFLKDLFKTLIDNTRSMNFMSQNPERVLLHIYQQRDIALYTKNRRQTTPWGLESLQSAQRQLDQFDKNFKRNNIVEAVEVCHPIVLKALEESYPDTTLYAIQGANKTHIPNLNEFAQFEGPDFARKFKEPEDLNINTMLRPRYVHARLVIDGDTTFIKLLASAITEYFRQWMTYRQEALFSDYVIQLGKHVGIVPFVDELDEILKKSTTFD